MFPPKLLEEDVDSTAELKVFDVLSEGLSDEWEVFHSLGEGRLPFGVKRVESPGEKHVIDLLREPASAELVAENMWRGPSTVGPK